MNVKFMSWECKLLFGKYGNGRTAIQLQDVSNGEPIAVATVNVPDHYLDADEVIIKDHSENEGMYQCLVDAGVVSPTMHFCNTGYVKCPVCKLLIHE